MLRSITEGSGRELTALANELGIKQTQVIGVVSNGTVNGVSAGVTLFYYE